MSRVNAAWHERHVMPRKATQDERIAWHLEHQEQCACRPIPPRMKKRMGLTLVRAKAKTRAKSGERSSVDEIDPRFAPVVAAFAKDPQVTYGGKGFGSTGLKVNGKLFAMLSSTGRFVTKLPKHRVDELVRLGKGERFDPGHGRLMKEWVSLEGASASWPELAKEARRFVLGKE